MEEKETTNENMDSQNENSTNVEHQQEDVKIRGKSSQRSKESYIIERKDDRIKKLEAELEISKQAKQDFDPNDEEIVEKIMQKKYGNMFEDLKEQKMEQSTNSFLVQNPEYAQIEGFEDKFKQYAKHPTRQNVPLETIAFEVAGKENLRKLYSTQSTDSVSNSQITGSSLRSSSDAPKSYDTSLEGLAAIEKELGL